MSGAAGGVTRYLVEHSDGRRTVIVARRLWIQHFHTANERCLIPPSPALETEDGTITIFDPRVRIMNTRTEGIAYDGRARWTGRGARIEPVRGPTWQCEEV